MIMKTLNIQAGLTLVSQTYSGLDVSVKIKGGKAQLKLASPRTVVIDKIMKNLIKLILDVGPVDAVEIRRIVGSRAPQEAQLLIGCVVGYVACLRKIDQVFSFDGKTRIEFPIKILKQIFSDKHHSASKAPRVHTSAVHPNQIGIKRGPHTPV